MSANNKKHSSRSKQPPKQNGLAAGYGQPAENAEPKDYPLVPLTNSILHLEETYRRTEGENGIQLAKQLNTQRLLCLITFLAFLAAVWYAILTRGLWIESQRQTEFSNRAYLAIGPIDQAGNGGLKIHLVNTGHIAAKITGGYLEFFRFSKSTMLDHSAKVPIPHGEIVLPGTSSDCVIPVEYGALPEADERSVISGLQALSIHGSVEYDTGFNKIDSIPINFALADGHWSSIGAGSGAVDLRNRK